MRADVVARIQTASRYGQTRSLLRADAQKRAYGMMFSLKSFTNDPDGLLKYAVP
jgi:hypothetical protein